MFDFHYSNGAITQKALNKIVHLVHSYRLRPLALIKFIIKVF